MTLQLSLAESQQSAYCSHSAPAEFAVRGGNLQRGLD